MTTAKTTIGMLLSAALLLGTAAATAGPGEARYRVELERCLAALRADLQDPATTKILYTVRDIEKQGAWYQFDIQAEVYQGAADTPAVERANRCRARRWSDEMEVTG